FWHTRLPPVAALAPCSCHAFPAYPYLARDIRNFALNLSGRSCGTIPGGKPMVLRSTVTDLENLLLQLEQQGTPPDAEAMGEVAERIGKSFQVAPDEVAVMELSTNGRALKFILPQKLQAVGTIPLTSTAALAARTARERRSDIVNNFSGARHASVFEGVPLGRRQGEAIQKIMSAPILRGDKVIGVAQISRK